MTMKMVVLDGSEIKSAEDLMRKIKEMANQDPLQNAINKLKQLKQRDPDAIQKEYDEMQKECDDICEKYYILNEDVKQFINILFQTADNLIKNEMVQPDDKQKREILFDFFKRFGHIQLDLKTEEGRDVHHDMRKLFSARISEYVGNVIVGPTELTQEQREEHINNLDRGEAQRTLSDSQWVMGMCNSFFGVYSHLKYSDCEKSCSEENTTPDTCVLYQTWLKYQDYLANQKGDA